MKRSLYRFLGFLGILLGLAIGYGWWSLQIPTETTVSMKCVGLENKRKLAGGVKVLTYEEREYEKKNCDSY